MTTLPRATLPLNRPRLQSAYDDLRRTIWELRDGDSSAAHPGSHWRGRLADSAVSTATAVSALTLTAVHDPAAVDDRWRERVSAGVRWLLDQQKEDGGWGDTELSYSNISATMLAQAALHLVMTNGDSFGGTPTWDSPQVQQAISSAGAWIQAKGGVAALRERYGKDKTFAVPILTNGALAGLQPWREVSALPFEMACFPQSWYRFLQLPVVSYAIPALVAIGQVRFHHAPCWAPWKWVRQACRGPSLEVLRRMQPASGGFLEAIPLTSFVVMSLAASGQSQHPVAQSGVRFLLDSASPSGAWPIDVDLAAWNTSLIMNAVDHAGEDVVEAVGEACVEWLLSCQHRSRHPFTGADPGGWGWTDLSGAVPDADDTPGALLALDACRRSAVLSVSLRERIEDAAQMGLRWLIDLQNRDGGWPTFCRGWGKLPFDRSGADLTAHALRAIRAWSDCLPADLKRRWDAAQRRGWRYLEREQRPDGAWIPLWFGNQDDPLEENPIYGTCKVLEAFVSAGRVETQAAQRGWSWLMNRQQEDGGWGGVEETALAVHSLAAAARPLECAGESPVDEAFRKGLCWLVHQTESGGVRMCSPIGFYFAKLWYYEKLYPLVFTLGALGRALNRR